MKDYLISDYMNPLFQNAFKIYFAELGINVKDWDGLFAEINADEGTYTYLRMTDDEKTVIGFIMFKPDKMINWFFEETIGFVREFWIAKNQRGSGHGSDLLKKAEEFFSERGIYKIILTTDTAEEFYKSKGYRRDVAYQAKNEDAVFVKNLK